MLHKDLKSDLIYLFIFFFLTRTAQRKWQNLIFTNYVSWNISIFRSRRTVMFRDQGQVGSRSLHFFKSFSRTTKQTYFFFFFFFVKEYLTNVQIHVFYVFSFPPFNCKIILKSAHGAYHICLLRSLF